MERITASLCFVLALIFNCVYAQAQVNSDRKPFKITHGPYLQHVSETGATIIWTTNRKSIAWVELAPFNHTDFYRKERLKYFDSQNGLKQIATLHTVRITNLEPGTRYRYRIFSKEVRSRERYHLYFGNTVATNVYTKKPLVFRTNDPSKDILSFLMVNDIHERPDVMKTLLINGNYKKADLIFFNGDMVNSLRSKNQMFDSFMDTAVQMFAGETPMYYAKGNHENRGIFAAKFSKYFPSPTDHLYYLVRDGSVCFIVLNSGEDKPDSDIEYGGIGGYANFDYYRTKEANWLKKAVSLKKFKSAPFKIAVIHIPPFGGWHGELEVKKKFVPILNKADIDVMLCAHLHRYVYKGPDDGDWNFPIIVNDNNTVLQAKADSQTLKINIINREKDVVGSYIIHADE